MGVQVILYGKVNISKIGAEAKASFKRAFKSYIIDPKTGDLTMNRLKYFEKNMEGRTGVCCNTLGRFVVGNEKL